MLNYPVLDVFIGLVFIYLTYGLMINVVNEIIYTLFGMRARVLEKAIKRMLEDRPDNVYSIKSVWSYFTKGISKRFRFIYYFFFPKKLEGKKTSTSDLFYDQTIIQKMGKSRLFSKPSYMKAATFSEALIQLLNNQEDSINLANIKDSLTNENLSKLKLGGDTAKFFKALLLESKDDMEVFRKKLENWYDTTMERVSGWYKRISQRYAFVIGLIMAISFNVDTISIVKMLSTDKNTRDQIVSMAEDYVRTKPAPGVPLTKADSNYTERMDSLVRVADTLLNEQIYNSSRILGLGWVIPTTYEPRFEFTSLKYNKREYRLANKVYQKLLKDNAEDEPPAAKLCWCDKRDFILGMIFTPSKFLGFLLTALALTLGAPFWFDLLSKLVSLRSTGTKPEEEKSGKKNNTQNNP